MKIMPAALSDLDEIEELLDSAFGPDRRSRTAYRLREGAEPLPHVSLVARDRGRLVGSIQFWSIELEALDHSIHALTLLGPVASAVDRRGEGIGSRLLRSGIGIADVLGLGPLVLIGDPELYQRFGFDSQATGGWTLPGPFEARRLLARIPHHTVLPAAGCLRAGTPAIAGAGRAGRAA
jgi:predicted N-acetyltransferase YhbS